MNYPPKEREKRSLDQRTDLIQSRPTMNYRIPCNYGTHPVITGRMTFFVYGDHTHSLQVKAVKLCETSFFSASFLLGEAWLFPVGFWATYRIWKLAVLQNEKNPQQFEALETMAANMNKHETFSGVISFEDMNFSKSTTENNSANS